MGAFIYVLRSMRIYYAYKVNDNMRSHFVFRFFKQEFNLVLVVCALTVLRFLPPIIWPESYPSPVALNSENDNIFFIRGII
jgi:hypothetical protein